MSCPISKDALDKLKQFIDICTTNPRILNIPDLKFFKDYIESLGGIIPEPPEMSTDTKSEPKDEPQEFPEMDEPTESDPEFELEFDMTGCVEPDKLDDNQKMGDLSKEVSEEDNDKADEKRIEAMQQMSEGNLEKAIELFTEAIELNSHSALLFAKRGQAYLRLSKPNACIRDCTRALEINCDSAAAYKFRGRAYRLLGEWELAAKDLRQACNIDFDEQTDEWLREVTPNAKRIEEHLLKKDRKKKEKEEKDRLTRIKNAREAHAKASAQDTQPESGPDTENVGGMPGMGDFYKLLQDPEIMTAFQDPEVAAAFQDISTNPGNFRKYQSNPKIMALITKISGKFSGSGMNFPGFPTGVGGFPGFPGAGTGGNVPSSKPAEDDNLD